MDEQYWNALTNRIQSAESFLKKSCYSHSPNLIERDLQTADNSGGETNTGQILKPGSTLSAYRTLPTTLEQLTTTIEDGRLGFKKRVEMNHITVLMGPALIGLSAISGLALQNGIITLIFGLLGISIVITMVLLKPGEEIQAALANLIQAETVSADFYNQVRFWAPYAHESSSTEDRQRASQALHDATTFALKALQDYVEPSSNRSQKIKEL